MAKSMFPKSVQRSLVGGSKREEKMESPKERKLELMNPVQKIIKTNKFKSKKK